MEYLVQIDIRLPGDLDDEARTALVRAERHRGGELVRDGHIRAIWRLDGPGIRNAGIWSAADRTELDEVVASLPMSTWMTAAVTPLHPHPLAPLVEETENRT